MEQAMRVQYSFDFLQLAARVVFVVSVVTHELTAKIRM